MPEVNIHSLGYTNLSVSKLCKLLNSSQNHYTFIEATEITNLGDPDLAGYGYSLDALYKSARPHLLDATLTFLFTSVPIEGNFFTRTIDEKLFVSTFYETDELLEKSGRTTEEYAALTIAQELLFYEFHRVTGIHWSKFFHQHPRGCLFDFCGIKTQKIWKLINCSICKDCVGKFTGGNINMDVFKSINRLLNRIAKPSIGKAVSISVLTPGLSFIYGGIVFGAVVNLFSSLILNQGAITRGQIWIVSSIASGVIFFPLAVYGWQWYQLLKRKMK